jgi:hypothetical protein
MGPTRANQSHFNKWKLARHATSTWGNKKGLQNCASTSSRRDLLEDHAAVWTNVLKWTDDTEWIELAEGRVSRRKISMIPETKPGRDSEACSYVFIHPQISITRHTWVISFKLCPTLSSLNRRLSNPTAVQGVVTVNEHRHSRSITARLNTLSHITSMWVEGNQSNPLNRIWKG